MAISLNNFMSSVSAYSDMSPDLDIRQQVNEWMQGRDRRALSVTEWCDLFAGEFPTVAAATVDAETESDAKSVLAFVYEYFAEYAGIDFSQVRPNDSLNRDLKFPLICWFDWTLNFCDDFLTHFDLDLSDCFDEADFATIGEMVEFLVAQVAAPALAPTVTAVPSMRPHLQIARVASSVDSSAAVAA